MRAEAGWGGLEIENLAVEAERYLAPSRNAKRMIEECGALVKFEIFIGRGCSVRSN
jgi:hypothetical protein